MILIKDILLEEPELNESVMPADRWVGVVNHNGSVILPPNQTGDRQHYHYGLDGYQYRFSYWPYKKEVSWWNFPSEEEDLAVKVEDYLIRKGYSVDRHVDYTGKKIRDVLNESMFPKDFDRHSLGSCMAAAELATNYLLSKGRNDFKVIEGMVSLYPDQEYRDKLNLTKMAPDENWNPAVADDEVGYRSFQYDGIIPTDAIKVL